MNYWITKDFVIKIQELMTLKDKTNVYFKNIYFKASK